MWSRWCTFGCTCCRNFDSPLGKPTFKFRSLNFSGNQQISRLTLSHDRQESHWKQTGRLSNDMWPAKRFLNLISGHFPKHLFVLKFMFASRGHLIRPSFIACSSDLLITTYLSPCGLLDHVRNVLCVLQIQLRDVQEDFYRTQKAKTPSLVKGRLNLSSLLPLACYLRLIDW